MIMKILIIKLSSIGDVVHTLPALKALREGFLERGERVSIDWLVEEEASGIIKDNPFIDEVIVVKNRGWFRNTGENLKKAGRLRSKGYDIVIDFQGLLKSGIWVLFSGGRKRVGFSNARELSHLFLNEKLPPYDPDRHAVDRYMDLARHVSGYSGGVSFPVSVGQGPREAAAGYLKEGGLAPGDPFFVVVPGARWATKLWSDEKFSRFIALAKARFGLGAVLVGGPSEKERLEKIRSDSGEGALNLAGRTSLKELYVLMSMSRFVLTVDSGPMHVAAAAGARVVALFGPTAPWRTGPYGKGHVIVRKGLECSPCFLKSCKDPRCMKEIAVEDALCAVTGLLETNRNF